MDINAIRKDFPILNRKVNGHILAYLDNAATSHKPSQVLAAMNRYYRGHNANVHRGIHTLSVEATEMLEEARARVGKFVGVGPALREGLGGDAGEIVFVRNATEAINLVAYAWGRLNIGRGDEIVLTVAEHHSNFVPWQQLAAENGAVLKIVPVDVNGELDEEAFKKSITKRTKLATFFHVSNVLGTINEVDRLSLIVHRGAPKAKILIDGAQAIPHMPVDITKIGCDFYVFTGHKMLGPMGIGVLWGRRKILEEMPPFLFGGEMISKVGLRGSSYNEVPWKFEAGTPNVAGAVGLSAACDYLSVIGMEKVREHELRIMNYALEKLNKIPGLVTYGPKEARKRGGVVSFNIMGSSRSFIHAHDVASILDSGGIAVRSGHHCAQPLMEFLGVSAAARASFYIYNTVEEVDRLVEGIKRVKRTFKL